LRRILLAVLIAGMLTLLPVAMVFALTTSDVTVTATPSYISITNDHSVTGNDFGIVTASTNASTAQGHITVTNTSSVPTNVSIKVVTANWTGGTEWLHSDTAIAGADTAGLTSSNNTGVYETIVKYAAAFNDIFGNLPANTNFSFELRLVTPTSFSDGTQKTNTVRLTATAA
jgi:hypothetical protein